MSASDPVAHFTRPGGVPESASESDDPTFATSIAQFGGIRMPKGGRQ